MLRLLGIGTVLVMVAATPVGAIVIDFNAPAYTDGPLPDQNDPLGMWTTSTDRGFINVENTATNGRLIIQPNPDPPFHNAMLSLPSPIAPDANNKIIASFDFFLSTEGTEGGNIWKMMLKDAEGFDLARVQGQKDRVVGRLPQGGGMITPPMIVGGGNPTTRTMFIEIDTTGDGGMTSYYQDSISPANLLGSFPYTTLLDSVALIQIETFQRTDILDNRARLDNIRIIGAPERHTWNIDSGGNWSDPANWFTAVPNAADVEALFGSAIQSPRTVTVNVPITVGAITFESVNAYTIAGPNALTLNTTSGEARLNVLSGSHTISAPITLADHTTITVTQPTSNLSLTGALTVTGQNLTKAGAGTLTVNNVRAAGLTVNEGTVTVAPNGTNAGASSVGSLSIAGGATPTAKLDLNNNSAVINYTGPSPLATVRTQLLAGRGGAGLGKTWNGPGITSSAANAANTAEPESRSIGFAENASLPLGAYTTFRGQTVDDTSVLMAFTRTGDANLDGVVNDDDVTIVSATYAPGVAQPSWALGDFDYNGFVDDDDITLLGVFYNPAAPPLAAPVDGAAAGVAAVPEPASLALFALGGIAIAFWSAATRRRFGFQKD
ncbi:MAG: PEP-CTERM sorting domain-containing protein [Pirellulales bacterium]